MHQFKDPAINDAFDGLMQSVNESAVSRMKGAIYKGVVEDLFRTGLLQDDSVFADAEACLRDHWEELKANGDLGPLQDAIREVRIEVRAMIANANP